MLTLQLLPSLQEALVGQISQKYASELANMPLERTFRRILREKAALWQRIPQMKWLRSRKLTLRSHWNLPEGVWVMLTSASIKLLLKHCSNPGALGLLPMKILLLMMHLLLLRVPPPFQSKCLTFKQLKETCCSLYWSLRLHNAHGQLLDTLMGNMADLRIQPSVEKFVVLHTDHTTSWTLWLSLLCQCVTKGGSISVCILSWWYWWCWAFWLVAW